MDPFIQFLLGKGGQPQGAQASQARPPAIESDEIIMEADPFPKRKNAFFDKQGTGGKILGTLGDALLVGTGHDPIYSERVKQQQIGDAMIDYTDNPERAIEMLSQVPGMGEKAAELWDGMQDRGMEARVNEAKIKNEQDEYVGTTHERALAYLGAATPTTYPQIKSIVDKWYSDRGIEPMFELPEVYDEDAITSLANGGIPITDQRKIAEDKRYNDLRIEDSRREEFGRNYREVFGQTMSNIRTDKVQDNTNARSAESNRTRREVAATRSSGGVNRPNIRIITGSDGKRKVVRN